LAYLGIMRKEWQIFLTAVQFLTRIEVRIKNYHPDYLAASSRYFPLVGMVVAAIGALVFIVVQKYISMPLAILFYMLSTIWVTGAFHEDGFADSCDAFGGGWTKEQILRIMKDSRLGTYGVIGLIGMLSTKFLLIQELPSFVPPATFSLQVWVNYQQLILLFLGAHSWSRLMAVTVIQQYAYVADIDQSKSKPLSKSKLSIPSFLFMTATACLPFVGLHPYYLFIIVPLWFARTAMARYFHTWIGGYTGDCLGAVQQVCEIVFYASALIIWRYFI
jgi:adenosylcobinamide-GDP ribazoletransferase